MNSRINLWENYRKEISKNADLQKDIQVSNKKVNILHKRIIEIIPDYDKLFPMNFGVVDSSLEKFADRSKISLKNLEQLFDKLNEIQEVLVNYKAVDNIDFSSHELDDILDDINKRKQKRQDMTSQVDSIVTMSKAKKIFFDKEHNMKKTFSIAIDGPSGSGKSTIARLLAEKYGLNYINTGLVYRSIALNAKEHGIDYSDEHSIVDSLDTIDIKMLKNEAVYLDGVDVTLQLRDNDISLGSSKVSAIKKVREWAVALQQKYGSKGGVVMDGRDTTFKVIPNAEIKIYLDTSQDERAKRRALQNKELGIDYNFDKILKEIAIRDKRDMTRKDDPLHRADDAKYIDATNMSIHDVLDRISAIIKEAIYHE